MDMSNRKRSARTGKHLLSDFRVKSLLKKNTPGWHRDGGHPGALFIRITPENNGARLVFRIGKASVTFPVKSMNMGWVRRAFQMPFKKPARRPNDFLSGITAPPKGGEAVAFGVCCDTFFERKIEPDHRLGTQNFWRDTFVLKQYPALRDKPVHEIIRDDAVLALEPRPPKTKIRVQWALASVWDWAKRQGYCSGDNPMPSPNPASVALFHASGDTSNLRMAESKSKFEDF